MRDAGGQGIEFNADADGVRSEAVWHEAEEMTNAQRGFEDVER